MNPKVDAFLKTSAKWRAELEKLRGIILPHGLAEELKWGRPCYTLGGSNVLILQGFKDYCAVMFCNGALLKDEAGVLSRPGENTHAPRQMRFISIAEITGQQRLLEDYIREAIAAEQAGIKVEARAKDETVPDELQAKLDGNRSFRAAFEALTPGRQRAYILHFSAPKQAKTRIARIEKFTPWILKGKGMHDRPGAEADVETTRSEAKKPKEKGAEGAVVLLSGGNPQIAKGDGDAPVQAYIAAMPGWKREVGRRLDALIVKNVRGVRKAVRWNSPFYGTEDGGWIVSFHVLTRYVKVTFFNGLALQPVPPGGTPKSGDSRWIDIHEDDGIDERQMAAWLKQAAKVPGWKS